MLHFNYKYTVLRDVQPGWEGRPAKGRLVHSHLQTTWQEVHLGSIYSNSLHDSYCYCQKLCRNKSIRVGCLHPSPKSQESPHLPPMPNLAPLGHHFVTETATLYPNHFFFFPGTCQAVQRRFNRMCQIISSGLVSWHRASSDTTKNTKGVVVWKEKISSPLGLGHLTMSAVMSKNGRFS